MTLDSPMQRGSGGGVLLPPRATKQFRELSGLGDVNPHDLRRTGRMTFRVFSVGPRCNNAIPERSPIHRMPLAPAARGAMWRARVCGRHTGSTHFRLHQLSSTI